MRRLLVIVPLVVVSAVGCGSSDDDSTDTVSAVTPAGTDPTTPATGPATTPDGTAPTSGPTFTAAPLEPDAPSSSALPGTPIDPSTPLVVAARDDLAARLSVQPAAITVVGARAVTWGDSSLGCPQPGVQYMQRLVDGVLVVFDVDGRRYEYHGGDPLFLCETPTAPSGGD